MSPVPLADLGQELGHANSRMPTRHYAHLPDCWRAERAWRHVPSFAPERRSVVRIGHRSRRGVSKG